MCDLQQKSDGNGGITITCKTTGKPVSITNDLGMYCEEECGKAECIKARDMGEALINAFTPKGPWT
jgi:hypothetical protein